MLAICLMLWPTAVFANCQLALALALDVSSSVDRYEYELQRDGVASALLSEDVQALLFSGHGDVALAVYEWSGNRHHEVVLDWTLLSNAGVLTDVAERIHNTERSHDNFPTALGTALGFGHTLLARAPDCLRRTLDMSGDGINNDSYSPHHAYNAFPYDGITVNGLVITDTAIDVHRYYLTQVIRGPGAFVELADSYHDFEEAMRRKLLREIGSSIIGIAPSAPRIGGG